MKIINIGILAHVDAGKTGRVKIFSHFSLQALA